MNQKMVEEASKKFYGKYYDLVKKEQKIVDKKLKENFLKKYPYADLSKFEFVQDYTKDGSFNGAKIYFINNKYIQTDIESDTFKNDPTVTKYIYIKKPKIEKFPKIWESNGSIQEIPKSNLKIVEGYKLYDQYPNHSILDYLIHSFRIYVNEKDYFLSRLPLLQITTNYWIGNWNDDESYYQVCFATYCASYCCGISIQHLTPSQDVFPIITSIMRFHLYFTIRRILQRMDGGEKMSDISREFDANDFYGNNEKIARRMIYRQKGGVVYQLYPESYKNDYKKYIPIKSDGFTKIGIQYLNHCIEAFIYSILGSQARTKQSIFSDRASALEMQKEF